MRPRPSHPLAGTKAVNTPPTWRSPSIFPYQRAKRAGAVRADRRSSMPVEYLIFICPGQIVITRTTAMSGHTIEKAPKSDAGRRTVAIPPNISDDIAAHLDAFVSPDPNAWVFAVSDKTVQRAWIASRRGVGRIETTVGGVEGTFGEWVSVMDGIPPRD
jgi:hypothetical protein